MKRNKVTCLVMGSGDPNSDLTWEQMSAFFVVKIAELEEKIEALEAQVGTRKGKKGKPQAKAVPRSLH